MFWCIEVMLLRCLIPLLVSGMVLRVQNSPAKETLYAMLANVDTAII